MKRVMDWLLSLAGIIILMPLMAIIAVIIKCSSKGPVFFKQKRIGIHKSYFYILKFRTMRIDTPKDCPTHLLSNPDRYITKVGAFLRKTSLDELPQLFNILKGDMSIVGPRPALWNQDDLIAERDRYGANDVRPGLTGWAQVNGRDELEIKEKAKLDGEYVRRMSLWFDFKCILKTVTSVLKQDGIKEGEGSK
ncbi:MAG: sugar transferase [Lachnospiraceae bacterium]|nr:sugar transferase [Lachnospiraceae bacterium]